MGRVAVQLTQILQLCFLICRQILDPKLRRKKKVRHRPAYKRCKLQEKKKGTSTSGEGASTNSTALKMVREQSVPWADRKEVELEKESRHFPKCSAMCSKGPHP